MNVSNALPHVAVASIVLRPPAARAAALRAMMNPEATHSVDTSRGSREREDAEPQRQLLCHMARVRKQLSSEQGHAFSWNRLTTWTFSDPLPREGMGGKSKDSEREHPPMALGFCVGE